jgi:hypothetical protein
MSLLQTNNEIIAAIHQIQIKIAASHHNYQIQALIKDEKELLKQLENLNNGTNNFGVNALLLCSEALNSYTKQVEILQKNVLICNNNVCSLNQKIIQINKEIKTPQIVIYKQIFLSTLLVIMFIMMSILIFGIIC